MSAAALVEASSVDFAYGDRPVLRGVTLALRAGEVVALLGPNGSGKSTLLRVLLGQLHPAGGAVDWDGRDVRSWSKRELARRVAYLPQSPTADGGHRVIDVLRLGRTPYWGAFGLESARDERVVRDVAATLDLADLLDRPMDQLSGGQRQRAFLGRCLAQEPAALLLDEPTTFLDLRHQVELLNLLKSLARERSVAVLMASHDLNVAATLADRLILLDAGAVVADGAPAQVLDPAALGRVYGVAMERLERSHGAPVVVPATEQAGDSGGR